MKRIRPQLPAFAGRAREADSGTMAEPVAPFRKKRISEKFD
ncbi:MAG: hypothetical protein OXL41_12640 [Nitrospinae bacterium]|nr:hypothetical protein [Nitrospinota bacterium]